MAKVRVLQSVYLISHGKAFNFNDEIEIKDEKLLKNLVENDVVDVLIDEKPAPKKPKRAPKTDKKEEEVKKTGDK